MKSIKHRIVEFIDNQRIERLKFYKEMSIAPSNFSAKGMLSEIGGSKISKILLAYPKLNARWLLTGEGDMFGAESQMIVGASGEGAQLAVQVLKDEITELQRKLIICHEQKDNLVTGYLPLNKKEPEMKKEKVE